MENWVWGFGGYLFTYFNMKYVSYYLLGFWVLLFLVLALLWGRAEWQDRSEVYAQKRVTAKKLLLTDLCLSTESRHTRHLSTPEIIAPFQDLPGYHEHFPSSSFFWHFPIPYENTD